MQHSRSFTLKFALRYGHKLHGHCKSDGPGGLGSQLDPSQQQAALERRQAMKQIARIPAKFALLSASAVLAVALSLAPIGTASAQDIAATEKPAAAPKSATKRSQQPQVSNAAHVYLLRGLLNIFSLGMDDLANKINARGVRAT